MGVSIVTVLGLVLLLAGDHASAWVEQPPPEAKPSGPTAPASTIQRRGPCDLSSSTINPANTFFLLSDVRACIESAAIDTAAATQTKQALTDLLTMYSFVDITANYTAEPRFAVQVDLPAMVSALPTSGITEYSFHSQIGLGFRKAWDTHTQYTLPSCFTDWSYFGPFKTYVYEESGALVMKVYAGEFVSSSSAQVIWQTLPATGLTVDLSSFDGKIVSSVNGLPWLDYYSTFADGLGVSRDPNTRLNEAINVAQQGGPFRSAHGIMPPNNTIALGFTDGSSQEFDIMAYYVPGSFSGNLGCTHTTSRRSAVGSHEQQPEPRSREPEPIPSTKLHNSAADARRGASDTTQNSFTTVPLTPACNSTACVFNTGMITLSSDFANQAVVMRISSFHPDIEGIDGSSSMRVFATEFAEASTQAAAGLANGSFTKFIIDVRGNGGGYLDLGYFGDYCLTGDTGSTSSTSLSKPGYIRHNDAFDQIAYICAACSINSTSTTCQKCHEQQLGQLFLYDFWGPSPSTKYFTNGSELYCPAGGVLGAACVGDGYMRDGTTCTQLSHLLYSQYDGYLPNPQTFVDLSVPAAACPKNFAKGNTQLFVLSDGQCGSTCSVFARGLQVESYAKTIALGGKLNTPMQIASFGGGQVWSSTITAALPNGFSAIRSAAGVAATAQVPDGFPTALPSAGSGFAFVPQEVIDSQQISAGAPKFPGIPNEFIFHPAEIRMFYSSTSVFVDTTAGLEALYQEAITRITSCASADCDMCDGTTSAITGCGAEPSIATCTATANPTATPTSAPTTGNSADFTVSLAGISLNDFDSTAQASFKSVVATNAGSVCGSGGSSICSALAVTISSFSRRDVSVSFKLNTGSTSASSTAQNNLSTYMATAQFVTDLKKEGGGLAAVTSVTITSGVPESSDDDNTVIWLCVGAAVLLLVGIGIGIAVYCWPKEESIESSTQQPAFHFPDAGPGLGNTQASHNHKTESEL